MLVRSRVGVLTALCGAALLSGCFAFPPFFPFPPGPFLIGNETLVVQNETDGDWVLSLGSTMGPSAFAIPAGETGEVALYGVAPTAVALLDADCGEVDTLEWDASFAGVRIEGTGTLAGAEAIDAPKVGTFVEYWECMGGMGAAPEAGEPLVGGSGSILLAGNDSLGWSLDVATAELSAMTQGSELEGEHALSPDGTQVAFSRYAEMDPSSSIFIAAAGGGDERLLVEDAAGPVWSPDGSRIAYTNLDLDAVMSGAFQPSELRIVNADGTGLRTLAEAAPFAAAPAWSPDGRLIAFGALPDGADGGDPLTQEMVIKVYDLDAEEARTVAEIASSSLSEPSWSPDGERLAFTVMSLGLFRTSAAVGIGTPDATSPEQIGALDDGFYATPIWSPDGAWIAVSRTAGMEMSSDLVAIEVASGDEVTLATGVLYASAWRPGEVRG